MTEQSDSPEEKRESASDQQPLPEIPESELPGAIVAMLFSATEPTRLQTLGSVTGYNLRAIRTTLESLEPELQRFGLLIQWTDRDHVQLATSPDHSRIVRQFLGIERTTRLSPAALEVLAVIGYRQPVTRPEIDSIRGVDSSGVLQTLVARELIEPVGRLHGPGNPVQYGTTGEFLKLFGLTRLEELPELPEELASQLEEPPETEEEIL
jgi:segregation and condensation protein B